MTFSASSILGIDLPLRSKSSAYLTIYTLLCIKVLSVSKSLSLIRPTQSIMALKSFRATRYLCFKLTPWLMEPGGSMPHLQGLSNNPYPEPNQPNYPSMSILILFSHLRLGLLKGLFPVGLPVTILKALLPSSILTSCNAHLNLCCKPLLKVKFSGMPP